MISKEEIKKLADLARIEIGESEAEKLGGEIDSILNYVGQVKEVSGEYSGEVDVGDIYNVLREDDDITPPSTYSKDLIAEFPAKEGDYLKVKKIL